MSKLFIAAAGSGKTTTLVDLACSMKDKKILFTTFTSENKKEIEKKFWEINGCIPENIVVQTWFSFLLQHGVKPYQGCILPDCKINGVNLVNEKSGVRFRKNGRTYYWGEDNPRKFYLDNDGRIYSDKISKLAFRENELTSGWVLRRFSNIYYAMFIDEIQDLAGYDLELIEIILKSGIELYMAGDPRQVTFHTHYEEKDKKYFYGNILDYISDRKLKINIDTKTLNASFRNNKIICDLANKLFPQLEPCISCNTETTNHDGIFVVKTEQVQEYIQKFKLAILRNNKATEVLSGAERVLNFGEAKGLSFNRVLIYPTEEIIKWLNNSTYELKPQSKSKLYVAITRARYSVAFFDKKNQIKNPVIPVWNG